MQNQPDIIGRAVQLILQKDLPPEEKTLIVILLRNGLRVNEICNPSNIKIINKWVCMVWQAKNKNWRQCTTAESADLIERYNLKENLKYWNRNRFYYYRILKTVMPNVQSQRQANQPITHAARNIMAQSTFKETNSARATATAIGNASIQASSSYVQKEKREAFIRQGISESMTGKIGNIIINRNGIIRIAK